ncbi:unnamed protein product [Lampetra fluviatilis]
MESLFRCVFCFAFCFAVLLLRLPSVRAEKPFERRVTVQVNPGLNSSMVPLGLVVNLVHYQAVGPHDTLHYVWSTIGAPTVLLVHCTGNQSQLKVDWEQLLKNGSRSLRIIPEDKVTFSQAVVFSELMEFYDVNDTADMEKSQQLSPAYRLEDFVWEDVNSTFNPTTLGVEFRGRNATGPKGNFNNGSISISVMVYKSTGREKSLPKLEYSANSTQFQFRVDKVMPRSNRSRFGLGLLVTQRSNGTTRLESVHTIDDEHTPSIFEMVQLIVSQQNASKAEGFVQWKPVAYTSDPPNRGASSPCHHYPMPPVTHSVPGSSIAFAYYGPDGFTAALNVSFGIGEDGFYNATQFFSWTGLVGYGTPAKDSFSVLVIIIMAVGLGISAVLLLITAVVACVKWRHKAQGYEPID